jgi:ATP-binding cassette subfamily B protein
VSLIIRLSYHSFDTAQIFDRLQTNLGSINDAIDLLYRPFEITDTPHAKALKIKENSVEFKNVTFSYKKNSPLFNKLNLTIAPNEKIGLVGVSGSGKSTLINLILRAFDLKSGKILISGQDISKVTQYSLHQNIALISQEPTLFNRSIMENIRFAKPKATDEEVYRAAKLAHIHDVIMTMPNGYNSIIGERGVKLSGGERQRIAIAAAILKDTPILILDEATSALDSQSEVAIEKALKNIMQNKTVIAIAHRLSTLKNMDRIIVLDNGKIIEQGSEKELLKNKSGTFSHLYKLQSDGYLTDK